MKLSICNNMLMHENEGIGKIEWSENIEPKKLIDARRAIKISASAIDVVRQLAATDIQNSNALEKLKELALNLLLEVDKSHSYCEIENTYRKKCIEEVRQQCGDMLFTLNEKIHGSNFSFDVRKDRIITSSRNKLVAEGDNMYRNIRIREMLSAPLFKLREAVGNDIVVYGEIFGGDYPHENVKDVHDAQRVQKGVFYSPDNHFYVFDIFNFETGEYMDWDEKVFLLLDEAGIPYCKPLFIGTLEECLEHPNDYPSNIYKDFGLPAIEGNICEGSVIKPVKDTYLPNGSRVILKNKNQKHKEKQRVTKVKTEEELPETVVKALEQISQYVTEPRMESVSSKIHITDMKQMGVAIKAYNADVMKEYRKDCENNLFDSLEKSERKTATRQLNNMSLQIVKNWFLDNI